MLRMSADGALFLMILMVVVMMMAMVGVIMMMMVSMIFMIVVICSPLLGWGLMFQVCKYA